MNPVELFIESCAAGGDGVGRINGKVIFVPKALPGEQVLAHITEERKDYTRGTLVSVFHPSTFRKNPECPLEGECGGCGFQHITYPGQLEIKRKIFLDLLRRVGKLDPGDILPLEITVQPSRPFGYRNRVQVHRAKYASTGDVYWGFMEEGENKVVEIRHCPVVVEGINEVLKTPLDYISSGLEGQKGHRKGNRNDDRNEQGKREWKGVSQGTENSLNRDINRRVVFSSSSGTFIEGNEREARAVLLGKEFHFPTDSFFQSNTRTFENVITHLIDRIPRNRKKFFDLYGGVGVFSGLFSEFFQERWVIEKNKRAAEYVNRNSQGGKPCGFIPLSLEEWIKTSPDLRNSLVLVDPPRKGISRSVREFLFSGPVDYCVYISCNPVTFARDLGHALRSGFTVSWIKLFDFFPQTPHFEVAAILQRTSH